MFSTRQGSYGIPLEDACVPPTDADAESMPGSFLSPDGRTFATKKTCAESRVCVACETLSATVELVCRGDSVSLLCKGSFSSVGTTEMSRKLSCPTPVSPVSRDFSSNGSGTGAGIEKEQKDFADKDQKERGGEGGWR